MRVGHSSSLEGMVGKVEGGQVPPSRSRIGCLVQSVSRPSSIGRDDGAVNKTGIIRGEEQCYFRNFVWLADTRVAAHANHGTLHAEG